MATKIAVYKANDRRIPISVTSDDVAVNVTGYSCYFTVKTMSDVEINDSDALIAKTATLSSATVAPQFYVDLTDTETTIAEGVYLYDYKIKDATGLLYNSESGIFQILPRQTIRSS